MNNTWAIVTVMCTDGVKRVGIAQDNEVNENDDNVFIMGLPSILAERTAYSFANKKGMETFDGTKHVTYDF